MNIGDLVKKALGSAVREPAGLGLVVDISYTSSDLPRQGYKVQWSNDYGTFWTTEDRLERVSENR